MKALFAKLGAQQNESDENEDRAKRDPFPPASFNEAAFPGLEKGCPGMEK